MRRLAYLLILVGLAVLAYIPLTIIRSDWLAAAAQAGLGQTVPSRHGDGVPTPLCAAFHLHTQNRRPGTTTHYDDHAAGRETIQ